MKIIARIQAAQGIRTLTTKDRKTLPKKGGSVQGRGAVACRFGFATAPRFYQKKPRVRAKQRTTSSPLAVCPRVAGHYVITACGVSERSRTLRYHCLQCHFCFNAFRISRISFSRQSIGFFASWLFCAAAFFHKLTASTMSFASRLS